MSFTLFGKEFLFSSVIFPTADVLYLRIGEVGLSSTSVLRGDGLMHDGFLRLVKDLFFGPL